MVRPTKPKVFYLYHALEGAWYSTTLATQLPKLSGVGGGLQYAPYATMTQKVSPELCVRPPNAIAQNFVQQEAALHPTTHQVGWWVGNHAQH